MLRGLFVALAILATVGATATATATIGASGFPTLPTAMTPV